MTIDRSYPVSADTKIDFARVFVGLESLGNAFIGVSETFEAASSKAFTKNWVWRALGHSRPDRDRANNAWKLGAKGLALRNEETSRHGREKVNESVVRECSKYWDDDLNRSAEVATRWFPRLS